MAEKECPDCEGVGAIWDDTACGDEEHCSPMYVCSLCDGTGVYSV